MYIHRWRPEPESWTCLALMRPNCQEMRRCRIQVVLCLLLDTPKSSEAISTVCRLAGLLYVAVDVCQTMGAQLSRMIPSASLSVYMYIGRCHIGNRASQSNESVKAIDVQTNMHTLLLVNKALHLLFACGPVATALWKGARCVLISLTIRVFWQDIKQSAGRDKRANIRSLSNCARHRLTALALFATLSTWSCNVFWN